MSFYTYDLLLLRCYLSLFSAPTHPPAEPRKDETVQHGHTQESRCSFPRIPCTIGKWMPRMSSLSRELVVGPTVVRISTHISPNRITVVAANQALRERCPPQQISHPNLPSFRLFASFFGPLHVCAPYALSLVPLSPSVYFPLEPLYYTLCSVMLVCLISSMCPPNIHVGSI